MATIDDLRSHLRRIKLWGVPQGTEHAHTDMDAALDELAALRAWRDRAVPLLQALSGATVAYGWMSHERCCLACEGYPGDAGYVHDADCPVTTARTLLEGEASDVHS